LGEINPHFAVEHSRWLPMTEEEQFAHFETMGEGHVRDMALQWQGPMQKLAYKWLEQKAQESKRRNEAAQVEQNRTARIAKNAAIVAAIAATIAVPLAIIAIIISTFAWIYPRH
jgi:hypothetical protein